MIIILFTWVIFRIYNSMIAMDSILMLSLKQLLNHSLSFILTFKEVRLCQCSTASHGNSCCLSFPVSTVSLCVCPISEIPRNISHLPEIMPGPKNAYCAHLYNKHFYIIILRRYLMIKTYVLDTNVLIQSPLALLSFEDNKVVLPIQYL